MKLATGGHGRTARRRLAVVLATAVVAGAVLLSSPLLGLPLAALSGSGLGAGLLHPGFGTAMAQGLTTTEGAGAAASSETGTEAGVPEFSLIDALRQAEETGPAMQTAVIALERARLEYEEAKAELLRSPSVVARRRAESAWLTAQRNYELARQDLTMQVAQAYYDVLRAEMARDLAERNRSQAEAQLESTRARYDVGMISEVDLLSAESRLASAEVELNQALAREATARMRFNRTLGRDLEAPFRLVDEFAYEEVPVDLDAAIEHALETRLELQRARDDVALRELELQVSDNRFTPVLAIEKARLAVEDARVQLEHQELNIILEMRENYQAVVEARARIPIQETNVQRTRESLRISQERFEAGVITPVDLLDAQKEAFEAETALIQAVFDYNVALARFFRGAGYPLDQVYLQGE